jgi:hypothetical protein
VKRIFLKTTCIIQAHQKISKAPGKIGALLFCGPPSSQRPVPLRTTIGVLNKIHKSALKDIMLE